MDPNLAGGFYILKFGHHLKETSSKRNVWAMDKVFAPKDPSALALPASGSDLSKGP